MKWLLIIIIYGACSEPLLTNTGREFNTEKACVEWAKSNKAQLQINSEMQVQCVKQVSASK